MAALVFVDVVVGSAHVGFELDQTEWMEAGELPVVDLQTAESGLLTSARVDVARGAYARAAAALAGVADAVTKTLAGGSCCSLRVVDGAVAFVGGAA